MIGHKNIVKMLSAVVSNTALLMLFALPCFAQDKSEEFFGRDFAKSPIEEVKPMPGFEKIETTQKKTTKTASKTKAKENDAFSAVGERAPIVVADQAPTQGDSQNLFADGVNILWIGVILNTQDAKHAEDHLIELSTLATKFDWTVGPLFTIGGLENFSKFDLIGKLMVRGGLLDPRDEVPSNYKSVKLSPTWIVQTDKGQVLLEAMGDLKKQINQKGQLVLKDKDQAAL